ncbi:hypothetical protein ABFS83_01G099100 [Erythranthe nasuta]
MAYAAILSLKQIMKLLSHSEEMFIYDELPNLNSFLETIQCLPSSMIATVDAASSETRVEDAVRKLEDLIDSHLAKQRTLFKSERSIHGQISLTLLLSQQLPIVKQELTSYLISLKIADKDQQQQQIRYCFSSSDYSSIRNQQTLVGLDEQLKRLKKSIWHSTSRLFVTSVVGMTGIGKTTLVKHLFYSDPSVEEEFEPRLFVHVGPQYNRLEEILALVLDQLGVIPSDELLREDRDYLDNQLSEALSNKKYLIVLEDVWTDVYVWHKLERNGFPDNGKGSRVIIISQIQTIDHSLPKPNVFLLPLLTDDQSWKLLRQAAFTSEDKCSRELEKIGKKIARNCEGLPAAILQVGENLRGKSFQEWKTLSENEDPLVITGDGNTPLSKALYFSYMMLPQYLKLCFLYMAVFPKHYAIFRSKLIKIWVAEGFLDRHVRTSNAEETAGEYLDLLIGRSVVLSEKQTSIDIEKTKKCRLHFTFRSLCVNEAKSEKFFHILKKYTDCTPENLTSQERLCVHNNVVLAFTQVHEWMESVPDAQSLLCFGPKQPYPIVFPLNFRLLKILDALAIRLYEVPHQLLALVHLTYLAITCDGELPNSISRLSNLEVLIFCQHHNIKLPNGPVFLPVEIWHMHKLKQLYCMGFDVPPPPPDDSHLENLLTLSGVSAHSCTMEVLSRIPNLQRIGVRIESAHDSMETFSFSSHFSSIYEEFESFKCIVVNPNLGSQVVHCFPFFPVYIKKICLSGCGFPWKKMEVIALLPTLRVLKLRWYAFCGSVWKTNDLQFPWLNYLLLEDLDIVHWESVGEQFPCLSHVIIRHCYKLENIPDQLESVTLVEVDDCSPSFVKKMREWRSIDGDEAKIHSSSTDL